MLRIAMLTIWTTVILLSTVEVVLTAIERSRKERK